MVVPFEGVDRTQGSVAPAFLASLHLRRTGLDARSAAAQAGECATRSVAISGA
jgi:hypothetical protein